MSHDIATNRLLLVAVHGLPVYLSNDLIGQHHSDAKLKGSQGVRAPRETER